MLGIRKEKPSKFMSISCARAQGLGAAVVGNEDFLVFDHYYRDPGHPLCQRRVQVVRCIACTPRAPTVWVVRCLRVCCHAHLAMRLQNLQTYIMNRTPYTLNPKP
jgi:hypothetical protein